MQYVAQGAWISKWGDISTDRMVTILTMTLSSLYGAVQALIYAQALLNSLE